jgi:competence protein ComEC
MRRTTPAQSRRGGWAAGGSGWAVLAALLAPMAGAGLQLQQAALWPASAYGAGLAAAACVGLPLWWRERGWACSGLRRSWLGFVVVAAVAFALTGLRAHLRLSDALPEALVGTDIEVTGTVDSLPRRLTDGVRFHFTVHDALHQGRPVALPRRLSLGWYRGWHEDALLAEAATPVRAGQRWRFTVRLKPPRGLMNPQGFDYELWAFEQGVRANGYVRAKAGMPAVLLDAAVAHPVERLRHAVRDAIDRHVQDERAAGLLAALAVGDQAAIERSDWELFRNTGVAHLVSISGLHVTMFAWLAGAAVGALWRRSARAVHWVPAVHAARWGGLACAAAYALLAGWGVPAQRTVWMLAAAVGLRSIGARWPGPMVLVAAGTGVSLLDPWALLQPGFWLSFAAVGMLFMSEPQPPGPAAAMGWRARIVATLGHGLRTQAAISVGLAPLTMLLFQQVSLVGFVANLVAIPVVTLIVTPLALLGMLVPPLWQLAAALVQALLPGLSALAAWPWATWTAPAAPLWAQAAGVLAGLVALAPLPWSWRASALPLALPLLAWPAATPAPGHFELWLPEVGQGGAAIVRTAGHTLLFDAGPQYSRDSEAGSRVVVPLLRTLGVRQVDQLVLSHRDSDHVGGAAAVVAALPVAALSSSLEPGHALLALRPATACTAGQRWMWDGVEFEMLHPGADLPASAAPNTRSCVLKVTAAGGRSALLTGDIEAAQEAALVQREGSRLASTVLVLPHHGSKTSSSEAFLQTVAPRIAVAQAGWRNRFGHPAPAVVARVQAQGATLVRSDACGAWGWQSAAPGRWHCERQQPSRQRYWRQP